MASDLKSDLVMMAFQRGPNLQLIGNPAVVSGQEEGGQACDGISGNGDAAAREVRTWDHGRRGAKRGTPLPKVDGLVEAALRGKKRAGGGSDQGRGRFSSPGAAMQG